jgi:hypothetical protein
MPLTSFWICVAPLALNRNVSLPLPYEIFPRFDPLGSIFASVNHKKDNKKKI